ncbi:unnamed protein product [Phyllotreta striolata]|uniref:Uncharacterized protein n=1 Tax=Phyllotreta striolata TaxID=444603 RepID=A0A9N9TQR4_PHYSR|nr:unnamed protein product [Phyllotreta striolata]
MHCSIINSSNVNRNHLSRHLQFPTNINIQFHANTRYILLHVPVFLSRHPGLLTSPPVRVRTPAHLPSGALLPIPVASFPLPKTSPTQFNGHCENTSKCVVTAFRCHGDPGAPVNHVRRYFILLMLVQ